MPTDRSRVAATLNSDQEELRSSQFPIEKQEDTATINPVDGTPDILIWGKATDGTIDGDREIVDPEWSAKAIQQWADTKANVRMSHDPKRPVGKGQEVQVTTDGHYVKSLICDPLAKHFIRAGVLNDYSVGISHAGLPLPGPEARPAGQGARGSSPARPDGPSSIAEISICDRGSNFNSSFQIVEERGRVHRADGRRRGRDRQGRAERAAHQGRRSRRRLRERGPPQGRVDLHLASGLREAADVQAGTRHQDRRRGGQAGHRHGDRRSLAAEGNAVSPRRPRSYPIENTGDLHNAAVLARSGHGDVAAARRLIARRAGELGVANPLDESDEREQDRRRARPQAKLPALQNAGRSRPVTLAEDAAEGSRAGGHQGPGAEDKDKPVKKAKKKPEEDCPRG